METSKAQNALGYGKPVFTQAMKDTGGLPPVGSSFLSYVGDKYCCIGFSVDGEKVVGWLESDDRYFVFEQVDCYPVKSPEEKLICELLDLVSGRGCDNEEALVNVLIGNYNITPRG